MSKREEEKHKVLRKRFCGPVTDLRHCDRIVRVGTRVQEDTTVTLSKDTDTSTVSAKYLSGEAERPYDYYATVRNTRKHKEIDLLDIMVSTGPLLLSLVLIFAGLHLTVFSHEAAHLLAAKAVGVEVLSLRSGTGSTVTMTTKRSGFVWSFGISPTRGNIYVNNSETPWHNIIVYLAGPAVNVLFAGIGFWLWWQLGYSVPVMCFAVVNALATIENMIPCANRDGAQILRELKRHHRQRAHKTTNSPSLRTVEGL